MTIKNTGKNVSAENHEDVVVNASFNNGILTLIRKNLYDESTSAQKNIEVDLSDHKLKLKVITQARLNALKTSTDPDDIKERESYIFLVSFSADEEGVYREYIWIEDDENFEVIGSTRVDLSNYIQKSNTNGLIKNDGTVDTNTYVDISDFGNLAYEDDVDLTTHDISELTDTQNTAFTPKTHTHGNLQNDGSVGTSNNASKNVVTDSNGKITTEAKPTIPSASTTAPSADTTNGSYGSETTYARADHIHPKSSLYAEATHNHSSSNITDMAAVTVTITYTDNTTETLTLFKQVNNS